MTASAARSCSHSVRRTERSRASIAAASASVAVSGVCFTHRSHVDTWVSSTSTSAATASSSSTSPVSAMAFGPCSARTLASVERNDVSPARRWSADQRRRLAEVKAQHALAAPPNRTA